MRRREAADASRSNGGSGWVAFNFSRSIRLVGELASQHASNISSTGANLTLTSYLAGPRYTMGRLTPTSRHSPSHS